MKKNESKYKVIDEDGKVYAGCETLKEAEGLAKTIRSFIKDREIKVIKVENV